MDISQQNNSDSEINGFFIYKGPRNSVKGCRIQFSLPLVLLFSWNCEHAGWAPGELWGAAPL